MTDVADSCIILLHEPHADVRKSGCMSALRMLTAARDILDLIHTLRSTSYDITLVDPSCTVTKISSQFVIFRINFMRSSAGSCLATSS
jgi:hypothetical protein